MQENFKIREHIVSMIKMGDYKYGTFRKQERAFENEI